MGLLVWEILKDLRIWLCTCGTHGTCIRGRAEQHQHYSLVFSRNGRLEVQCRVDGKFVYAENYALEDEISEVIGGRDHSGHIVFVALYPCLTLRGIMKFTTFHRSLEHCRPYLRAAVDWSQG